MDKNKIRIYEVDMTEKEARKIIGRITLNRISEKELKALDIAAKALEKQIPKVPTYSGDGYYNGEMVIDTWECPCCGKQYEVDYDDYEYCPNCGQHIDHSTLTEDD